MRFLIALIAGLLLGVLTADASACGRCGLFGRKCRFACNTVHTVAYAPPVTSQNFIFNNVFPSQFPYLLAQGGSSVFGYQASAAGYAESPALYMDRAARFTEQANENARLGIEGFNTNAALAIQANDAADRRQNNTMLALAAMEANRDPSNQVLQVTIQNGQMSVGGPGGQFQALQAGTCSRCHDGRGTGKAPKSMNLLPSSVLTEDQFQKCLTRIMDGTMPPSGQLDANQQKSVITALSRLVQRPAAPPAPENPIDQPPPIPQPPGGY